MIGSLRGEILDRNVDGTVLPIMCEQPAFQKKGIKTNRFSTFSISKFYDLLMFPLLFIKDKSIRQNQKNI